MTRASLLALAAAALTPFVVTACGDGGGITAPVQGPSFAAAVVLNSVDNSLSVVPLDASEGSPFTVGLGPAGTPTTLAARKGVVVVPLGVVDAAAVVDLETRAVRFTVPLPANSGATGAAFLNDSLAVVANPNQGSVTVVNVRSGTAGVAIPVGGYPHRVLAANDTVWVLNAHLGPDFLPTRTGTVEVLTGTPLARMATIQLSGTNPGGAALHGNRLWVVNSGTFLEASGSLSEVSRPGTETRHVTGFGFFPGDLDVLADGTVAVASYAPGLALWDPVGGAFVRNAGDELVVGAASIAALGVTPAGQVWVLEGDCVNPARAFVLDGASLDLVRTVGVGTCPIDVVFAEVRG